eukprot:13507163-Ditylum_brightwellii.AAC.1
MGHWHHLQWNQHQAWGRRCKARQARTLDIFWDDGVRLWREIQDAKKIFALPDGMAVLSVEGAIMNFIVLKENPNEPIITTRGALCDMGAG